jgi:hypothetical protein
MRFQVSGDEIPAELIDIVALLTDRARLRYAEVEHDPKSRAVRLPMTRFPLLKKRRVLPNVHDLRNPIPAVVTIRNVVSCEIENHSPPALGREVQLIFGVQLEDKRVYACSAEEDKGKTCFSVTLEVSELDVEITDLAKAKRDNDA